MLSSVLIKYQARRWNDDFTIFTICVCGDYFPIPTLYPVTLPERASRSSPSGSGWWCTCSIKTFGFSSALTLITCEISCQVETQTEKRSCGLMDKALDFGSRDWGFESLHDHDTVPPVRYFTYGTFFAIILYFSRYIHIYIHIYRARLSRMSLNGNNRSSSAFKQPTPIQSTVLRRLINSLEWIEWAIIMKVSWSCKKNQH